MADFEVIIDPNRDVSKEQLSEQEQIEWFKVRTRQWTTNNSYSLSFIGDLSSDLWDNLNIDILLIRDRIQTYFFNLFEWEGKHGKDPEFRRELERVLFRFGKVAIVKLPNGDFVPVNYSFEDNDTNFYGRPEKITIHTDNEFNGTQFTKYGRDFIIGYNNLTQLGTLFLSMERVRQTVRALIDVDNSSLLMRPKIFVGVDETDHKWIDINDALLSDRAVIAAGNLQIGKEIQQIEGAGDNTIAYQDNYHFQLSNMLKLLGLQANMHNKAERMSELEVSRNDEFDNLLLRDMFDRRIEFAEEAKKLGVDLKLDYNEIIETDEKQELNGELNKAKEKIDNEK